MILDWGSNRLHQGQPPLCRLIESLRRCLAGRPDLHVRTLLRPSHLPFYQRGSIRQWAELVCKLYGLLISYHWCSFCRTDSSSRCTFKYRCRLSMISKHRFFGLIYALTWAISSVASYVCARWVPNYFSPYKVGVPYYIAYTFSQGVVVFMSWGITRLMKKEQAVCESRYSIIIPLIINLLLGGVIYLFTSGRLNYMVNLLKLQSYSFISHITYGLLIFQVTFATLVIWHGICLGYLHKTKYGTPV